MIKLTAEGHLASRQSLDEYEKTFSRSWPEDFKEFLITHNVTTPENNKVSTTRGLASVSKILGFSSNLIDDLRYVNTLYDGRIPNDFLVIAHAGGGNLFCIDLKDGAVYFWEHELEPSGGQSADFSNLFLAASSFTKFLEKISPLTNDDIPADAKVISATVKPGFAQKFGAYIKR